MGPQPIEPRTSMAWRIANATALVAFVAYFFANMKFRYRNLFETFSLQGDQHQSIGHYWRYAVEGTIPNGHLISDYANTYHAPPLWWLVMATLSTLTDPIVAAKAFSIGAYALYATMIIVIVGRRTHFILGCLAAILVIRIPPGLPEQITGGMARCMAPTLFLFFLWAMMKRNHPLALLTLVVQAAIYPSVVIPCGLTYGAYCVLAGPNMRTRLRRCAGIFVVGMIVIATGLYQDIKSPDWWGPTVTYEEAKRMPAWGPGGRFPEVPHARFEGLFEWNVIRPYKELGTTLAPPDAVRWVNRHSFEVFLYGPLALSAACALVALGLRRRRGDAAEDDRERRFPWELVWLFIGSIAAYWLVRLVAFKLFLPARQIGFTIRFLVEVGMPLLVWWGVAKLFPRQHLAALVVTALVLVVPPFAFRGHGLDKTEAGYRHHKADTKTYLALRKLPKNEQVACDLYFCEFMMPMGQHAPFAARNLSHPLRPGYYEEVERRLVAMHEVLFATSADKIHAFVDKEKVRFFVYNVKSTEKFETKKGYRPFTERVLRAQKAAGDGPPLLANPPKEAIVFRDKDRILLDLSTWPR
jgi:hypothetical protein